MKTIEQIIGESDVAFANKFDERECAEIAGEAKIWATAIIQKVLSDQGLSEEVIAKCTQELYNS